jgi:hypothetical protein
MASRCRTHIFSTRQEAAHLRAERVFRPRLPGYVELLFGELLSPFRLGLDDLAIRRGVAALRQIQNIGPLEHDLVF